MLLESGSIPTAAAALAGVLALIWLIGRFVRSGRVQAFFPGGGTAKTKAIAIEDSLALDPRRRLVLVRCETGRVLLLTGATDLVIGWLPASAPPDT